MPVRLWFAAVAALLVAAVAPAADARPLTTAPNIYITVKVTLTDARIVLSRHSAPRGTDVRFVVTNVGTEPHTFTLGTLNRGAGLQTGFARVFRPREHEVLLLFLDYRGVLPYYSSLKADRSKRGMHGKFVVGVDVTGSVN
jgi:hypothetical protein